MVIFCPKFLDLYVSIYCIYFEVYIEKFFWKNIIYFIKKFNKFKSWFKQINYFKVPVQAAGHSLFVVQENIPKFTIHGLSFAYSRFIEDIGNTNDVKMNFFGIQCSLVFQSNLPEPVLILVKKSVIEKVSLEEMA